MTHDFQLSENLWSFCITWAQPQQEQATRLGIQVQRRALVVHAEVL